ncbi:MAG: hypothetical protein ACT4PL_05710 [Phycisphaerales bacterium]
MPNEDRKAIELRLSQFLAGSILTFFEPPIDSNLVCALSVEGRIRESAGLPGTGSTETAVGECYVQAHRASYGHPVGPVFRLAQAKNSGLYLHASWIIEGEWILWHDEWFLEVWSIRHDWNKDLAELERLEKQATEGGPQ